MNYGPSTSARTLTTLGGKYAARIAVETNIVVLEPEIAEAFPNDKAVNEALRGLLDVAATTARLTRRPTGRAG